MTENSSSSSDSRYFKFLRGADTTSPDLDWQKGPEMVRKALNDALNARNFAFLMGAGCSSHRPEGSELGIATMSELAKEFCSASLAPPEVAAEQSDEWDDIGDKKSTDDDQLAWALSPAEIEYLVQVGVDLTATEYSRNLERLLELLHSLLFVLQRSNKPAQQSRATEISAIIEKVQRFLLERCSKGAFSNGDHSVRTIYEVFYRKLVLRDRSLPRPWIFTTNYDLFNEVAMDRLGLPYANGFSGVIERRFNPATFRYALAEQLDVTSRKWSAVDGFVYLCKLHGSISWTEDDHGLFPIRERWPFDASSKVMIFPTPAKQNASLGSPYADLIREFQSRLVREQSVLITVGYRFGDQHLNNIIYQALTVPTFRLIVFADPNSDGEIAKLRGLSDPRIWIIGGDGPTVGSKAHYFDTVVEHFMPQRPIERVDEAVQKVLEIMGSSKDKAS
ncbi:MAG: SIR2 family protein [Pseudomonadota bacterium]|nr:SIR2 family protein [Pseudomonadota bacterium]